MATATDCDLSPSLASSTSQRKQGFPALFRSQLQTLQVNLGYRCNQSCSHCHVDAGPWRTEMMAADQVALIPQVLQHLKLKVLDLIEELRNCIHNSVTWSPRLAPWASRSLIAATSRS